MTAGRLRQIAAEGIEIGSHALHHVRLTSLSDSKLREDLVMSRRILQDISGQDVGGFCYPYGDHDQRGVTAAEEAGFDYSCAVGYSEFTGRYALSALILQMVTRRLNSGEKQRCTGSGGSTVDLAPGFLSPQARIEPHAAVRPRRIGFRQTRYRFENRRTDTARAPGQWVACASMVSGREELCRPTLGILLQGHTVPPARSPGRGP